MYDNIHVSREIIDNLKKYQSLVLKWNKTINLISGNTEKEFWERHVLDSLQLLKYINDANIHLVDIGSGGGLPGIVLSIAGVTNITLIESDIRKSVFLLQASKISSNKVNVINQRIENIKLDCDILTSRAFASLDKVFIYSKNITVKDKYLLSKGKNYQREIEDAQKQWSFQYSTYNSVTSSNSKILEIRDVTRII
jgi:16S rRNA (guanine527-N7)-methyltransferase